MENVIILNGDGMVNLDKMDLEFFGVTDFWTTKKVTNKILADFLKLNKCYIGPLGDILDIEDNYNYGKILEFRKI